eukprot:scaffold26936_cov32-Attheya_sp.AAC.4
MNASTANVLDKTTTTTVISGGAPNANALIRGGSTLPRLPLLVAMMLTIFVILPPGAHAQMKNRKLSAKVKRAKSSAVCDGLEQVIKELEQQLEELQNTCTASQPQPFTASSDISLQDAADRFVKDGEDWIGGCLYGQNINDWDVSQVTDFIGLFDEASAFNDDIGDWNVSSGTRF